MPDREPTPVPELIAALRKYVAAEPATVECIVAAAAICNHAAEIADRLEALQSQLDRLRAVVDNVPDSVRDLIAVAVKRCLRQQGGPETDKLLRWNDMINESLTKDAVSSDRLREPLTEEEKQAVKLGRAMPDTLLKTVGGITTWPFDEVILVQELCDIIDRLSSPAGTGAAKESG